MHPLKLKFLVPGLMLIGLAVILFLTMIALFAVNVISTAKNEDQWGALGGLTALVWVPASFAGALLLETYSDKMEKLRR